MGEDQKQMKLYLIFVLGICWALGITAAILPEGSRGAVYQILQKGFTLFPVAAAVLTRRITKDRTEWRISVRGWKQPKLWAFCAFAPGILMMLVCVTVGIFCSYVMVRSGNVMYSAVIHGVVNVIGEIPVLASVSHESGLLGPNPTGIIGLAGLLAGAVILFAFADRWGRGIEG